MRNNTPVDVSRKSTHVIVSGATGFIGQHLIPILLKNGYTVVALARDTTKAKQFEWYKDVQYISIDFHKVDTIIPVTPGAGLIHLAWQGLPNYQSLSHFDTNLPYSYRFIKSLVMKGVKHVLVSGTCLEYGACSGPLPSTMTPNPNNPYAVAKNSLRQYLEFFGKETSYTLQWARLFYLYGRGQNPNSVLSQLDTAMSSGATVFNMSGGEQLRDYLPVEDAAQQIFNVYSSSLAGTYNICSGNPISIRRLVEQRIAELGVDLKLNLGFYPYPEHEPMAFWGVRDIR